MQQQQAEVPSSLPTLDVPEWIKVTAALAGLVWGWLAPLDQLLIVLVLLDILSGIVCAAINRAVNSDASYRGMLKKALILILLAMAHFLDPYAGTLFQLANLNISVSSGVATFFAVNEVISITENAATAGVPIPKFLRDMLSKVPS